MIANRIIFHFPFSIFHFVIWRREPVILRNGIWEMSNDKWEIIRSLPPAVLKRLALLGPLLLWMIAAQAQPATDEHPGDPQARVIDGVVNTTVFGLGQSIRITGAVKEGAIAFGGDVIVEGSVDGDVAAIGGSVIQREGS